MREPPDFSLGGALSHEVVKVLNAQIVCNAANNKLAHDGIEKRLAERDIAYAPDYCVNSERVLLSEPPAADGAVVEASLVGSSR